MKNENLGELGLLASKLHMVFNMVAYDQKYFGKKDNICI